MITYNTQLSGYDYNQYNEGGEISYNEFVKIVENFPWEEQLKLYEEIKSGCSATISVINQNSNNVLWISIGKNDKNTVFLIGYVFIKKIKPILGFGKEKTKKWVDIYMIENISSCYIFFNLFFNHNYIELISNLSKQERINSMEVPN